MAASDMKRLLLIAVIVLAPTIAPTIAFAQSAGEVERCFQNPGSCSSGGAAPPPSAPAGPATASRGAPAPDYTSILNSPEPDRRKIQESLRALDKYNGAIDGNLQSEGS